MRPMNLIVHEILLATAVLMVAGCDKPTVMPANAGTAAADMSASAARPDAMAAGAAAEAQLKAEETRGAMLYSTHCAACHTSEIHWREKKLVTDFESLRFQVRRWQASIGQDWTEDEIADVVRYLNTAYYGFAYPVRRGFMDDDGPTHALRKNIVVLMERDGRAGS